MNERIYNIARRFLLSASAIFLCVSSFFVPVYAEDVDNLTDILYPLHNPSIYYPGVKGNTSYNYWRLRWINSTSTNTSVEPFPMDVYALIYRTAGGSDAIIVYSYISNYYNYYIMQDYSNDGLTWTNQNNVRMNNRYTGSGLAGTAQQITYGIVKNNLYWNHYQYPRIPFIQLEEGQNETTILQILSYNLTDRPWSYNTTPEGGIQFNDDTELTPEQRAQYEQIYIVMDISQDNSVTQEEVNFYNATYNTNYDYSQINNGDDFTEIDFLRYIALQIGEGNENPGGGTGTGGSGAGAGIYIGDGSFTQSQTQTIAENAVNVTVSNNNTLSQENMQEINNIINNSDSDETTFQDAISNMNQFRGMAIAFAALAGVVLGWLPSWVVGLLGMMFSILSIMIVIRLIHLFV